MSFLQPPTSTREPISDNATTTTTNTTSTLELTIRFSASLPDLPLSIPISQNATTSTVKQLIRAAIPSEYATRRIRLIYAGKALIDDAQLTTSLRLPSRPPSRVATPGPYEPSSDGDVRSTAPGSKAGISTTATNNNNNNTTTNAAASNISTNKGKTPVRDPPLPSIARIYIHCSIGDVVLTPAELAAEAALAHPKSKNQQDNESRSRHRLAGQEGSGTRTTPGGPGKAGEEGEEEEEEDRDGSDTASNTTEAANGTDTVATTIPAPRGFDRLLAAGFSIAEVQSLRLQFMAIQSHTHTPDTMPSPNTMRNLEDEWLDDSDAMGSGSGGGGGGGGDGQDGVTTGGGTGTGRRPADEDAQAGALDDIIWGAATGFLWPVGCLMWGSREEGIWSQRRKMAVVVGVVLNVGLGFVRYTS